MSSPTERSQTSVIAPLTAALAIVASTLVIATTASAATAQDNPNATPMCLGYPVTVDLAAGDLPTSDRDIILGTEGDDIIAAGGGDDVVCGLGGNDVVWGQEGADQLSGGPGDDRMRGGPGEDSLFGGTDNDDLAGGPGDDRVRGDGGSDRVRGGTGDDFVTGDLGADVLVAGNGGSDYVSGGDGDDALVTGGPRSDIVLGDEGSDRVKGNGGADAIFGGAGSDDLFGGPQGDHLDGGEGINSCNGGTQHDRGRRCEAVASIEVTTLESDATYAFAVDFVQTTSAGAPYANYVEVTDPTGILSVHVPATPDGVVAGSLSATGGVESQIEWAAQPDASLDIPMLTVSVVDGALDLAQVLAQNGPDNVSSCTVLTSTIPLPEPAGYEGLFFADPIAFGDFGGLLAYYESCHFGETQTNIAELVLRAPDGRLVKIRATIASIADLILLDEVLPTIELAPVAPREAT